MSKQKQVKGLKNKISQMYDILSSTYNYETIVDL